MSFEDIYGHERQVTILKKVMEKKRVAHAYLFYGMDGVGKRATAGVFAKALNCKEGNLDSCDRCSSCIKIDNANHCDVITIKPDGVFIKIQQIRSLQKQLRFKPLEGIKRVFIIEDAEKMNAPSANALLKTLEEPNPHNILILITSHPHQLPETILSRCHKIRFNPIRRELVAAFLENKMLIDGKSANLLASSSGGSIGRSLEMRKESYLTFKDDVLKKIATRYLDGDPFDLLLYIEDFGGDKRVVLERLAILRSWYRDMMLYKETGSIDSLVHRDMSDLTTNYSKRISSSDIINKIKAINQAHSAIGYNTNKQLILESMMLKLFYDV